MCLSRPDGIVAVMTNYTIARREPPVGIAKIPAEALATMAMAPLGFTATWLWGARAGAPKPCLPVGSPDESR